MLLKLTGAVAAVALLAAYAPSASHAFSLFAAEDSSRGPLLVEGTQEDTELESKQLQETGGIPVTSFSETLLNLLSSLNLVSTNKEPKQVSITPLGGLIKPIYFGKQNIANKNITYGYGTVTFPHFHHSVALFFGVLAAICAGIAAIISIGITPLQIANQILAIIALSLLGAYLIEDKHYKKYSDYDDYDYTAYIIQNSYDKEPSGYDSSYDPYDSHKYSSYDSHRSDDDSPKKSTYDYSRLAEPSVRDDGDPYSAVYPYERDDALGHRRKGAVNAHRDTARKGSPNADPETRRKGSPNADPDSRRKVSPNVDPGTRKTGPPNTDLDTRITGPDNGDPNTRKDVPHVAADPTTIKMGSNVSPDPDPRRKETHDTNSDTQLKRPHNTEHETRTKGTLDANLDSGWKGIPLINRDTRKTATQNAATDNTSRTGTPDTNHQTKIDMILPEDILDADVKENEIDNMEKARYLFAEPAEPNGLFFRGLARMATSGFDKIHALYTG